MSARSNARARELSRLEPFTDCSYKQLEAVAGLTDDVHLREGEILMREDTVGRECFVITEGEALVRIGDDEVARLGPGEIVGEMALLDREPRTATVVATTLMRAVVMTTHQFTAVADLCPSVTRRVMTTLAQRLREAQAA